MSAFPDLKGDYILYTDASGVGIDAVLTQDNENEEQKGFLRVQGIL